MKKGKTVGLMLRFVFLLCFALRFMPVVSAETVVSFAGNNSYVNIGTPAALQIPSNDPFTVEGWMYLNATSTRDMLYCKNLSRGTTYTYMFGFYEGDRMGAYIGHGGSPAITWRLVSIPGGVATDRWYHLAFSFDGVNVSFYLDGELLGTSAYSFGSYETHAIQIGGYSAISDINGFMSDVRVWDYARSQSEIRGFMGCRLNGAEFGLLGYWPLDEGADVTVYDNSIAGGSDGEIINASWAVNGDLTLEPRNPDFAFATPFTLADKQTGDTDFTNSNEVDIVDFPVPDGYDLYQLSEGGDTAGIDQDGWLAVSGVAPDELSFAQPGVDEDIIHYAWFTNSADSVIMRRASGGIRYTTALPVPLARADYTRGLASGHPVVVYPYEIDNGSTGGTTGGEEIPVYSLHLCVESGPGADETPEEPFLTISGLGVYQITLTVTNAAGNAATSMPCQLTIEEITSSTFIWEGNIDSDWFNPLNWDLKTVPFTGAGVVINDGDDVALSAPTAELGYFIMTGGQLTFRNWDTILKADSLTINGTVTHDAQPAIEADEFGEWPCDHRVVIQCSQFVLQENGAINVDGRGYQGAPADIIAPGRGPGAGGATDGGAGYGGRGGKSRDDTVPGLAYGDEEAPEHPGSSGGRYRGLSVAGHGGGVVRIDATGTVVVNGLVSANGVDGTSPWGGISGGGGSGGSIYISCDKITGSGNLRAEGGAGLLASRSGGGGGGGRIAIDYNPVSQSGETTSLSICAAGGMSRIGLNGTVSENGKPGTIWMPDTALLRPLFMQGGALRIPGFTSWTLDNLVVTNGLLALPESFALNVVSNIELTGTGGIELTNSALVAGGNLSMISTHELAESRFHGNTHFVQGTVSLSGGSRFYLTDADFHVDGDFMCDDAYLDIQGTDTNDVLFLVNKTFSLAHTSVLQIACGIVGDSNPPPPAVRIAAGRMFAIDNSWVYPHSHPTNGGSVKFDIESQFEVSADSGFNADYMGFEYGAGDGKGVNGSASGGGGYGGPGGDGYRISGSLIVDGGVSYGNSNAPARPGSGGGYYHGSSTPISRAKGGGLIWINAPTAGVKMDGIMTANGQNVGSSWGGGASGGGSGGAIFIDCLLFEGQGLLSACGGNGWSGSAGYGGSGGGGRIAVRRAVHKWSGSPSPGSADDRVKGGDIVNASHPETEGHDGTIVWIEAPPGGVVVLFQ